MSAKIIPRYLTKLLKGTMVSLTGIFVKECESDAANITRERRGKKREKGEEGRERESDARSRKEMIGGEN